jgi:hypothetical protein
VRIEHGYKGEGSRCLQCNAPRSLHRGHRDRDPPLTTFYGIDGEGQTDHFVHIPGRHRYIMLCAASEKGKEFFVENPHGLSTIECFEFLLSLPVHNARFFTYSFGYDLTKILEDVDDLSIYKLVRPELRRRDRNGRTVLVPVFWPAKNPKYSLNWMNGRFTIRKVQGTTLALDPLTGGPRSVPAWGPSHVIHDVWRFFQGKFTTALEDWRVPNNVSAEERKRILDRMREMKDKRAQFDRLTFDEIRAYCFEECRYMAVLARKLTEAHVEAKIPLKNYFGAGSSAEAMLLVMNVKEHVRRGRAENPVPHSIEYAMRCAFFGGRFENSRIGAIPGPVYGEDISSAYPYQLISLPCLIHGKWKHTKRREDIENVRTALIRYVLEEPTVKRSWAPFPFRTKKTGSIAFPEVSGGGWIWQDEYRAGEKLFPNVRFVEAYLYEQTCHCQPFKDIPKYYAYRVRIGKEGPGIVVKLGTNSCYGKTAQTVGGEPGTFHAWMWAGLITSGCRAQVLVAMAAHQDLDNLLMVATDGIATLEKIVLPKPQDTSTEWLPCPPPDPKDVAESPSLYRYNGIPLTMAVDHRETAMQSPKGWEVNKPLGGWEEKILPRGLFLARPGIYFPLDPTEKDMKRIRARGLGRTAVWEHWSEIVAAFQNGEPEIQIPNLSLFRGMKTGITRSGKPGAFSYKRSDEYGRWTSRPVIMTFNPWPKREGVGPGGRLGLRRLEGEESAPYDKGILSPEAAALLEQAIEESEQPDGGDLADSSAWDEG